MATAQEVAREYFPDASDAELEHIIWGKTGFPGFWPNKDLTPEENFRNQLKELQEAVKIVPLNEQCDFCFERKVDNMMCQFHIDDWERLRKQREAEEKERFGT